MFTPHDIQRFQRGLKAAGHYSGPIDGNESPDFQRAVIAFKKSIGFRARYLIGPLTKAALLASAEGEGAPWMAIAQSVRGLHERRDVSQLRRWFVKGVSWIDPRDIPWCGAFVASVIRKWGPGSKIPDNPLGARNWGTFGQQCKPQYGAILTFWRGSPKGWKGHVAFYVGEDATHYHVLGGNQRDRVSVTRIAKDRLLESRWPLGLPVPNRRVFLTAQGVPVTENEA